MNRAGIKGQLEEGDRLDGWKRIAGNLDCDVRTAKRWEKDRDLPIHRHHHAKQASVYAFAEELEQWQQGITPATAIPEKSRPFVIAGVVGGAALLVIGTFAWIARGPQISPVSEFPVEQTTAFPPVLATGLWQAWTDNDWHDYNVYSDGQDFAWKADMEGDSEVFVYRNGVITQVTNDDKGQGWIVIDGDRLVWLEGSECNMAKEENTWDCAVWIHENGEAWQLTDGTHWEGGPSARDGSIVWMRYVPEVSEDVDIYLYRDGEIQRISGSPWWDHSPVVSGERIVWVSDVGGKWELFEYDGSQINQLTDDDVKDRQPSIDGQWLAWVRNDGNDDEIMLTDGTETWQLSDNEVDDVTPMVFGGRVTWTMKTDRTSGDGCEIMAFDGSTVYQLTDDLKLDWIRGHSDEFIVWHRQTDVDLEIVAVAWADLGVDVEEKQTRIAP